MATMPSLATRPISSVTPIRPLRRMRIHEALRSSRILALLQDLRRIGGRAGDRVFAPGTSSRPRTRRPCSRSRTSRSLWPGSRTCMASPPLGKDRLAPRVQFFPSGREKRSSRSLRSSLRRSPCRPEPALRSNTPSQLRIYKINRVMISLPYLLVSRHKRGFNSYTPRRDRSAPE
jgi:hypothetical protein